eukprot:TRINITY_DN17206_c0_g1_i1.p1 TRINITY_DN17206_c0_g1~~TRINITY_DN17206_c0_g1_i1.p1  ORF type:complete len:229 (-),score=57.70 TRINITY_DN17206_c0_g1_i1:486-1172(-)
MGGGEDHDVPATTAEHATPSVVDREETDEAGKEEEDTGAQVAPIVTLEEVAVSTGEENEDVLIDLRSKLYRFDREGKQWKERGAGQVKLLQHRETKKIRLLMRQNRTLKICANHLVVPSVSLGEHAGSDKSWVWHASDFSDGELKEELFCIRFGNIENAQKFKSAYEEAQDIVAGPANAVEKAEGDEAADEAADLLGSLDVKDEVPTEVKSPIKDGKVETTEVSAKDN